MSNSREVLIQFYKNRAEKYNQMVQDIQELRYKYPYEIGTEFDNLLEVMKGEASIALDTFHYIDFKSPKDKEPLNEQQKQCLIKANNDVVFRMKGEDLISAYNRK